MLVLLWFLFTIPQDTIHAQGGTYPQGFELLCPAGSQALSQLVTYNPSTQRFRANYCIDANGTITQVTGANPGGTNGQVQYNNNGVFGGTTGITFTGSSQIQMSNGQIGDVAGGQKIQFSGTDLTLQTYGGTNIRMLNPLTFTTTTFASLGSVSAAGVGSKFCTDCTPGATCAGAGSGHLAISNGTNWTCQ